MTVATVENKNVQLGGVEINVGMRGDGPPLLLLTSEDQLEIDSAVINELAKSWRIITPTAPGFGSVPRPDWFTSTDDIAYVYLDLIEKLGLQDVTVMGFAHGGWIAAEMAVKDDNAMRRLILCSAYGVKIGGPYDADIADIWITHPAKVMAMKWADSEKGKRDYASMSDDQLTVIAQNTETFARYCWEPYMHNPKLRHRLHRITVPSLFVWGEQDGMTPPKYGKAYAGLVPGAKFVSIANAGHYPQIEQPEAFLKAFRDFTGK